MHQKRLDFLTTIGGELVPFLHSHLIKQLRVSGVFTDMGI